MRAITFCGSGFMGIYGIGVAQCLKDKAPFLLDGIIAGASSGSLIALALSSGVDLQVNMNYSKKFYLYKDNKIIEI